MNKNCIVFDLDETLISTANRQLKVILDYFKACDGIVPHFPLDEYLEIRKKTGKSNFQIFQYLNNAGFDEDQFNFFFKDKIESLPYLNLDTLIVEIDKLRSVKDKLKCDFNILSLRCNATNATRQLKELGLINLFDRLFFKEHSISINPKTSTLIEIKNNYHSICFVGDSESDYFAAKEAKIPFIKLNSAIVDFDYSDKSFFNINSYLNNQFLCSSVKIN